MGLLAECSTRKWRRWRPGEAVFNPLCGHCDPSAGITAALDSNSRPIELSGRAKGGKGEERAVSSLLQSACAQQRRVSPSRLLARTSGFRRCGTTLAAFLSISRENSMYQHTQHASRPANYSKRERIRARSEVAAGRDVCKNGIFVVETMPVAPHFITRLHTFRTCKSR